MKVVWTRRIGASSIGTVRAQCQSAAAYDGHYLYMAWPAATVGGKVYRGSVERLDPATGAIGWQTGLPEGVLSSPAINASGVIGLGTYDNGTAPNATYLISASTGAVLPTLNQGAVDFPQSAFADGWPYTATGFGLAAWQRVAEADGNRTRRRRRAPHAGFEDRGAHQVPRRLRSRPYRL